MTREEFLERIDEIMCGTSNAERAYLENLYNEVTKPQWISVEDELPEEYVQVLCHGYNRRSKLDKGYIFTTCRVYKRDDYKRDGNGFKITDIPSAFSRVTHWMPLPQAPKEGGGL